jgi:hypothetical protein
VSSPASAESKEPGARRPRRFWARLVAFVGAGLFCLPAMLQIERHPQRAETLQVLGPASPGGGHGGAGPRRGARSGRIAMVAPRPFYGALREGSPSELETVSSLRGRAATVAASDDIEVDNPRIGSFATPAAAASTEVSFVTPSIPSFPLEPTILTGTSPVTPTTPETPTPPVIAPPIVIPPVVTPPVTPPTTPPVVTPPDNPPVTPPVVVTPPDPSTVDPFQPPIDGGNPDPGGPDPGGSDPGGLNPIAPSGPPGTVPEPSVWMQLILGAGLAGAALRRRPRLVVA